MTGQIADCLPPRDGRTAEDAHEAAGAIARGLLEFAVFELQPEIFQKVVLARLQQMTDQASALDEALFRMHKDLYHLIDEVKDLFQLVSDRLPPGRADLNEIKIYLNDADRLAEHRPVAARPAAGRARCSPRPPSSANCGSAPPARHASRTPTLTSWHGNAAGW